jgi:hypothetical protein
MDCRSCEWVVQHSRVGLRVDAFDHRTDGRMVRQAFVNQELINPSIDNWRTRWYDKYQYCCLGIL